MRDTGMFLKSHKKYEFKRNGSFRNLNKLVTTMNSPFRLKIRSDIFETIMEGKKNKAG